MLFLILHIVGNTAFTLLVKLARTARFDYAVVGLTNYATAAGIAAVALGVAGLPSLDAAAALFGLVNGVQYLTTFLLMYALIGMAGVAITTSFLRLSVAVPVLASIVIWREWPTPVQAAGLVLAAIALPLLSSSARAARVARIAGGSQVAGEPGSPGEPGQRVGGSVAVLVGATVLISGCGLLAAKAFAELHRPEQRPVYVAACFLAATLCGGTVWRWREALADRGAAGSPVTPPAARYATGVSVLLGAVIGTVNVGQIWVLLPALAQVPGVVAFPVAAAGGLALTACGGWLFWREPLAGRTGAGIALAVLAAGLANAR